MRHYYQGKGGYKKEIKEKVYIDPCRLELEGRWGLSLAATD